MKKKFVAGASVVVLAASTFGFAHVFAENSGQENGGETGKEPKDAPKVETVKSTDEKKAEKNSEKEKSKETKRTTLPLLIEKTEGIEEETTKTLKLEDGRKVDAKIEFNDKGEKLIKAKGTPTINVKEHEESLKNVRERTSEFIAEQSEIFAEQSDDPRLKQTGNDEGFNYYLQAEQFVEAWKEANINLMNETASLNKDFNNIMKMQNVTNLMQFSRTSHLRSKGQAMEDVENYAQWEETPEEMRQAYEYIKQIIHDLDVAFNHDGEGETYDVTHTLNGDNTSEVESFFNGDGK